MPDSSTHLQKNILPNPFLAHLYHTCKQAKFDNCTPNQTVITDLSIVFSLSLSLIPIRLRFSHLIQKVKKLNRRQPKIPFVSNRPLFLSYFFHSFLNN